MKFFTVIALLATSSAITLRKNNPNGPDVTLAGDRVPWPQPPIAKSEAKPNAGSAVDASSGG